MSTVNDYLNLITSEHRDKPKFIAMITAFTEVLVRIQDVQNSMITLFDVDVAVGAQLDVIGEWVGISRNISIPIASVYFSWDGTNPYVGWDYGVWQGASDPTTITTLPDDSYRVLIRAKIAANHWDGTTNGAYLVWESTFPKLNILIQDHQNMSYDLIVVGGVLDALTQALLTGGYIPLKPEGVRVNAYYLPVNSGPVFGWDVESEYIKGWDEGSWTREIAPT